MREKLESRMFLAKPDFCKCIMDLRGLLFEMSQAKLIDIKTDTAHQLRDLVLPSVSTIPRPPAANFFVLILNTSTPLHGW